MGPVVTCNSATMVNKGLEVIEAHLLFDVPFDRIDVVVHPQSIVHSMVEFVDGSTIAQVSPPDMRLPIALGMTWPERLTDIAPAGDWTRAATWQFEPLDDASLPPPWPWPNARARPAAPPRRSTTQPTRSAWPTSWAGNSSFDRIVSTVSDVVTAHLSPRPSCRATRCDSPTSQQQRVGPSEARRRLEAHR